MEFARYWNDESVERGKPWWIEDVGDSRILDYLQKVTNLQACFEDGLTYAELHFHGVRGVVLDLGAGVCWTTALVSRQPRVTKVLALDYSVHRMTKIGPLVCEQLGAVQEKIERRCIAMSPLPFADESADLAILCQALYMSRRPVEVLREVHRVLRPGGLVMVACEGIEASQSWPQAWRRRGMAFLRHPLQCWGHWSKAGLPDASGRYPYRDRDYEGFVVRAGFRFARQTLDYPVFKESAVVAANYFGVKEHRT